MKRFCSGSLMEDWDVVINECLFVAPSSIQYPTGITYPVGSSIKLTPSYSGFVQQWTISPSLPAYLSWNPQTGSISGVLEEELEQVFTIVALNANHTATISLSLDVLSQGCQADGIWPATLEGKSVSLSCTAVFEDRYIGNITRMCTDSNPPQWGVIEDHCVLGPPHHLHYPYTTLHVFSGFPIPEMIPSWKGKGDSFFSKQELPSTFYLNEHTGEITQKGSIQGSACYDLEIGVKNEVGDCFTSLKICTFDQSSGNQSDKENRLGNLPKQEFWYFMIGGVVVFVFCVMIGIPYCIRQEKKNRKRDSEF